MFISKNNTKSSLTKLIKTILIRKYIFKWEFFVFLNI